MEKSRILAEIRRLAAENDGVPPGQKRFGKETGLSTSAWCGKYWRQWSHALEEAGFSANKRSEPIDHDVLVVHLAALMRKLGRVPSVADMRLARRSDTTFPHLNTFQKLGSAPTRVALLRAYLEARREDVDLLALLPARGADDPEPADSANGVDGTVYMFRHGKNGKHYKIGHTYDVPRRHREIKLELPEELVLVHAIRTDDPSGIEAYWKRRFAAKCTNGEWFTLSREEIAAFKRRKFM